MIQAFDTEEIILSALNNLGLSFNDFLRLLNYPEITPVSRFKINRINATEWMLICQVLHLCPDVIRFGYSPEWHQMRR